MHKWKDHEDYSSSRREEKDSKFDGGKVSDLPLINDLILILTLMNENKYK